MLKKLLLHKIRILLALLCVALLAMIRGYEDQLFYDPFLDYFKSNYAKSPIPNVSYLPFFGGLFVRFLLNSIVSLAIIYICFNDLDAVKFSAILFAFFFVILSLLLFILLAYNNEPNKMILFYTRRFLIQPVLLILFLPAFYFQKQKNS